MNINIPATLRQAAALITERGLAKGVREDDQGRLCVHGAISVALGEPANGIGWSDSDEHIFVATSLASYLEETGQPQHHSWGCADWNNAPARTAEQVIAALEGAAQLAEGN